MQKDIIDKKIYAKRVLSTGITKNRTKLCVQPGPTSVNLINLYTNSKKNKEYDSRSRKGTANFQLVIQPNRILK